LIIDNKLIKYFIILFILYIVILLLSVFIFPSIYQIHTPMTIDKIHTLTVQTSSDFFIPLLYNNILASFIIVMMGGFGIWMIPPIFLCSNAIYLGSLISSAAKPDTYLYIYAIFPHATIELPTIILATTFGCYFAIKLRDLTGRRNIIQCIRARENILQIVFDYGIKPYILVILPLIILGCVIESYVSLYILKAIFNGV